ncbi:MAG: M56 family metallopeptidase [Candidatus Zhuqueibacterota bacterium]
MTETLNHLSQQWAIIFSSMIIQNTLFLIVIFIALALLKNADARLKYVVAFIGLLKLLVPPYLPAPFLKGPFSFSNGVVNFDIGNFVVISEAEQMTLSEKLSISVILLVVWGVTAGIAVLIPFISTIRLRMKLREAVPVKFEDVHNTPGLDSIRIYKSSRINMPLTLGIFSNKVYVPNHWENWTPDCRRMILQHELAHIRRRDGLSQLIQLFIQAIYFFHPLVWILNQRLNQYREMACDDASVESKKSSHVEYSRYLVKIAEDIAYSELGCSSASALIRQKNELLKRVQYQITEATMKHISKKSRLLIAGVLILLMVPFSWSIGEITNGETAASEGMTASHNESTGKITGVVIDVKTGVPLSGATVAIDGTNFKGISDVNGSYTIADVPPGVYNLLASSPGFMSVKVASINVKVNLTTSMDFKLVSKELASDDEKILQIKKKYEQEVKKVTQYNEEVKKKGSKDLKEMPPMPEILKDELKSKDTVEQAEWDESPSPVGGMAEIGKHITYPAKAREQKLQGVVWVNAFIDVDGKVAKVKIEKEKSMDNEECVKAAMNAVQAVKWTPAKKDGKAVGAWVTVPINFTLK